MCVEKNVSESLFETAQMVAEGERQMKNLCDRCRDVSAQLKTAIAHVAQIGGEISVANVPTDVAKPTDGTRLGDLEAEMGYVEARAAYVSLALGVIGKRLGGADDVRSK